MQRKDIPTWVLTGGILLTLVSGCVNAVALLGVHHNAVSHMSGMMTNLGITLAGGQWPLLRHFGSIVASFFLGGLVSGYILRESSLRVGRRYGAVLVLEALVLVLAARCLDLGLETGDFLAALACGLQNGMASSYSGAVIRTTHCTGMVTDFGIALGQAMRGREVRWDRVRLYASLIGGFFSGALLGSLCFARLGVATLYLPALFAGCLGLGYSAFRHHERLSQAAGDRPVGVGDFVASLTPVRSSSSSDPSLSHAPTMSTDFLSARVINKALDRLASLAEDAGLIVEVALCHGRVFVVAYRHDEDLSRARRQVLPTQRTLELLREVSREMRLPSDWIQEDLRYHLALQAARGSALREQARSHLVLSVAAPALILAVKLHAYNATPGSVSADAGELAFLLEKTGLDSVDAVEQAYATFYPAGRLENSLRGAVAGLLPVAS
jgi:uncharacterized membrane protein YoaK (UPF0700 family)